MTNAIDLGRFRAVVAGTLGLSLEDTRCDHAAEVLHRRSVAHELSIDDYLARLEARAFGEGELRALASELTVGETYFFRHAEQLDALVRGSLPELVAARAAARRLRVLSAGCSSGEEPFSLAILLRESLPEAWSLDVRAVDVRREALEKAERGRYSSWALRETRDSARARWFRPVDRDFVLAPEIRALVRFEEKNLACDDRDLFAPAAYDVVFCRNVLMYLTPDVARALVERLARALAPGGFLFLGHAETLRGLSQAFHLRHTHGAFYYQRRPETARAAPTAEPLAELTPDAGEAWVDAIQRASDRVKQLAERALAPPMHEASRLEGAIDLVERERWREALEHLGSSPADPDVLLLRAAVLAQRGSLDDAERTARELLAIDELDAGAHYVLALCREAAGDALAAAEHDRLASYLDGTFAMPRLHLGLAARRSGDVATARVELGRAIELLHREEPARLVMFGGGFGREVLIAMCRAELRACGGAE